MVIEPPEYSLAAADGAGAGVAFLVSAHELAD